jgi:hypothetical protein
MNPFLVNNIFLSTKKSPIEKNNNFRYVFEKKRSQKKQYADNITVETVTDLSYFKKFYNFPYQLYHDNKYWVPTFWIEFKDFFKSNNPFWKHAECKLFIVKKEGTIVGRIAGIIDNKFCESVRKNIGYFGFFECIESFDCAKALFSSVEEWLLARGMSVIRGPINGRIDISCGFLLDGFDTPPTFLSIYSQPYYIGFCEKYNMKKSRDFFIYNIDLSKPIPKKLIEDADSCEKTGIQIRHFDRLHTQRELKWWIKLFLETFKGHWGYVPVSDDEVRSRFGVKQLQWVVDKKLFLVAELDKSPIAYLLATPDYNQVFKKLRGKLGPIQILQFLWSKNYINEGKLHFIGINNKYRNKKIGSYLNYNALIEMKNRGYKSAKVGLIDEKNLVAHSTIAKTNAKIYKKYRVFDKKLEKY